MFPRKARWITAFLFVICWIGVSQADDILVTRHFTGAWGQVEHQSQGLTLEVVEQFDDSRVATAFWYTYGPDRRSAWYMGIGTVAENRIEFTLYISEDMGFMQLTQADTNSISEIGTMSITFDDCNHGDVIFDTDHEDVGSGSFEVQRLTDIMNTHCSGGISDNMHADTMYDSQRLELMAARDGISGSGHANYAYSPGHAEFEAEVSGLPDGPYRLVVGMVDRGGFTVVDGFGEIEFHSPEEFGRHLLTFEPHGVPIEIHDNQGPVLFLSDGMFNHDDHHERGDDNAYECGMGGGMGGGMGQGPGSGMDDCVNDGEMLELQVELINSGVIASAQGDAEWEMTVHRVEFGVEIEGVPVGTYALFVAETEVGQIEATEYNGEVTGEIEFRDPQSYGKEYLDFDPRGQQIQIKQNGITILEVDFPEQ
jgi:hypothetical protein